MALAVALAVGCDQAGSGTDGGGDPQSELAGGAWDLGPEELVFQTLVGTVDTKTFEISNDGDAALTVELSPPRGDGGCPEEPFLPLPASVTVAPNARLTVHVEHAPTVVPPDGSCLFRVSLTEADDPDGEVRVLRLDGGVQQVEGDADSSAAEAGPAPADGHARPFDQRFTVDTYVEVTR